MSKSNGDGDNDFEENGDLGLGLGLKPGGIRVDSSTDTIVDQQKTETKEARSRPYIPVIQNKYHSIPFFKSKLSEKNHNKKENKTVNKQSNGSIGSDLDSSYSARCSSSVMSKSPGTFIQLY